MSGCSSVLPGSLGYRGVKVIPASNTIEADAILQRETVDVIVCDIVMPGEDGLSYVRGLRERGNHTPVIFLSALAMRKWSDSVSSPETPPS